MDNLRNRLDSESQGEHGTRNSATDSVVSNYPRANYAIGKTAKQLTGLVDAYGRLLLCMAPILAAAVIAIGFTERGALLFSLTGMSCVSFVMFGWLLLWVGTIRKAIEGLTSVTGIQFALWFTLIVSVMSGFLPLILLAIQIAVFVSLRRNGLNLHPLLLNRKQIYSQIGSIGAAERRSTF